MASLQQNQTYDQITRGSAGAQRLLDLCLARDWSALKNLPVLTTSKGQVLASFGQDRWETKGWVKGNNNENAICFLSDNRPLSLELLNEMKALVIAMLYFDRKNSRTSTVARMINDLKNIAYSLNGLGYTTLDGLDIDTLSNLGDMSQWDPTCKNALVPLAKIFQCYEFLPYALAVEKAVTHKDLAVQKADNQQTAVIPLRIYFSALDRFSRNIDDWYKYREELRRAFSTLVDWEQTQKAERIHRLRCGELAWPSVFLTSKSFERKRQQFLAALEREGIDLVDHGQSDQWLVLCEQYAPTVKTGHFKGVPDLVVAGKSYGRNELKNLLQSIHTQACYLILALSGMRCGELHSLNPELGCQTLTIEGEAIHLFHTATYKISLQYKGRNDVFVTTTTGSRAFSVLNAIHGVLRARLPLSKQHKMFCSLKETLTPKLIEKVGSISTHIRRLHKWDHPDQWLLDDGDISMLAKSDPARSFEVGKPWMVHPHQLRRSLAYYLVGFELADYPQLKQQFKHYSIAMTIYYARNASSFRKMHDELENERVHQQAKKFANVYQRLADGHRLAGGKGKQWHRDFENNKQQPGYKDRKLSPEYWLREIRTHGKHIHAIAPGMYCTNRQCDMRMAIDLSECVDCDFDIIETATYAEVTRQEAMRMLLLAEQEGWLEASQVSRDIVRIRSAERIMADLGVPYTPFELSETAGQYLIASTNDSVTASREFA